MTEPLIKELHDWIDFALSVKLPMAIVAFNFNLYEGESAFAIELIGAPSYDTEDDDWACDDQWKAAGPPFYLSFDVAGSQWKLALETIRTMLINYCNSDCSGAEVLKASQAVTVGFVNGDLEIVWLNAQPGIAADASRRG